MKKIVLGLAVLVAIVIAVCFTLRSTANSKIEAKIEELKKDKNTNVKFYDLLLLFYCFINSIC